MSLQSRSLSGQPFIQEHHIFLSIAARAHQWSGNVWVPAKVAARLQLPLKPDTTPPLRLEGSNGHSLVYHTDQFTEPLETLQKAWNDFAAKRDSFPAGTPSSDTAASADASAPAFPLSTNGERFDRDTEERILRCIKKHKGSFKSPYWSTAAEAESIFHSPFRDAYLADTSRAVVASDFVLCRPVTLYNVDGTSDPSRFTSTTCRRYDPVNYKGRFYRPSAAVRMKAFAVRHNCLHERQWITARRALLLGFSIPHSVSPISFFFSYPVDLINVAVLRRSTLIRGHIVSSAVSPHNANEVCDGERKLESDLLLPTDCVIKSAFTGVGPATPTSSL